MAPDLSIGLSFYSEPAGSGWSIDPSVPLIQALVMDIVAGRSRHQLKSGVPWSMKMGTIASPCRYDAAARHALQSVKLRGVSPGSERPPNVEALMDRLSQVISRRSHWLLQTRKLSTALIVRSQLQLQIL
jgi:hypothetical protein